jgi:hypothetical protein
VLRGISYQIELLECATEKNDRITNRTVLDSNIIFLIKSEKLEKNKLFRKFAESAELTIYVILPKIAGNQHDSDVKYIN